MSVITEFAHSISVIFHTLLLSRKEVMELAEESLGSVLSRNFSLGERVTVNSPGFQRPQEQPFDPSGIFLSARQNHMIWTDPAAAILRQAAVRVMFTDLSQATVGRGTAPAAPRAAQ